MFITLRGKWSTVSNRQKLSGNYGKTISSDELLTSLPFTSPPVSLQCSSSSPTSIMEGGNNTLKDVDLEGGIDTEYASPEGTSSPGLLSPPPIDRTPEVRE